MNKPLCLLVSTCFFSFIYSQETEQATTNEQPNVVIQQEQNKPIQKTKNTSKAKQDQKIKAEQGESEPIIEKKQPSGYFKYNTVAGDTIYIIAQKNNLDIIDILDYNPDLLTGYKEENIDSIGKLLIPQNVTLILPKYPNIDALISRNINLGLRKTSVKLPFPLDKKTNPLFLSKYDRFITHVVKDKETKYGISKQYHISIQILEQFNPQTIERLDKGMMLLIPEVEALRPLMRKPKVPPHDTTLFGLYIVKPKETLYGISKVFHINVDSLRSLNPHILGIMKEQDTLIVPLYFNPLAEANGDSMDKVPYKGEGEEKIALKKTEKKKHFALFLPFMLNKIDFESEESIKETLASNKLTRLSLSFYKGVMMAFRQFAGEGLNLSLEVFDTQANPKATLNAANKSSKNRYHAIIGPVFNKNIIGILSSRIRKTPIFLPFSNTVKIQDPNLIQTIPSEPYIRNQMIEFITMNTIDKPILLIVDEKTKYLVEQFSERFPNIKVINTSEYEYLHKDIVNRLLNKNKENWVILETNKVWLVSNTISLLNALTSNFNIQLATTYAYKSYEDNAISKTYLSNLNFLHPTIFHENEMISKAFKDAFKEIFNAIPDKYAFRGFDVAFDVLTRFFSDKKELADKLKGIYENAYLGSHFNYALSKTGHYKNYHFYLLNYSNLKISTVAYPLF